MQQYYNKISEQKRIAFVDNLTDEQALEISENYPFAVCFANADIDPENGKFPVIWLNGQRYGFSSINQNTTKINDVNLSLYIDENGILGLTAENNDFNITPNTSQTITESYLDVRAIIPNHDYSKLTWTLLNNSNTDDKTFKFNNSNGNTISEVQSVRVIPNNTSKPAAKSGSINLVINNGTQSTANGKITLESTFTKDESINENTYFADLKATYESLTPKQIRITYKNSTPGLTVGNWAWNIPTLPEGITYEINNIDKKSTITFTNNTTSDYTINGGIIKVSNTNANPNEISVDEFTIPGKLINSVDISWNDADLGTINGIELGTINTTSDLLNVIKILAQAIDNTYLLTLSATSGSITRPKGSLSSIAANGGSDNITVTVGSTANITAPTSLTLTYGANTNKTASTPTATYNGTSVTPSWSSSNTSVAEVNGTTITAKGVGSATLTATYNDKTATYNLTVTNESTSSSVTSGWTYTSDSTNIATILGTTVTGVAQGTTNIKINYSGKTCDLSGTVTVNAIAPQLILSSTSGSITRPKGSLSSIAANGGSDNITVTVGSTANITAPTSLTLTYATNTNKTASTPTATYNGTSVTPSWSSSNISVAEVNGTTITAKAAGSATLTASYDGKIATYNLTVTNESTSGTVTSGWTYTSDSTNIATISGTTVTGVAQGTTNIKVNYSGKTCDLSGTVTVNAVTPQVTYYWYVGTTKPTSLSQANTVTSYPAELIYTNNSGAKSHIFVLTNNDKNVTFINIASGNPVDQNEIDTTTISGYKIFETAVGTANTGSIKIRIS